MPRLSILLVEDDPDDEFFIKNAFRRTGISLPVEVAKDGDEAVKLLTAAADQLKTGEGTLPGIVLLDLKLPRRTGLDVLKWIRQDSPWKTLVVIVLTSSTSESDMHQAYLLGANAYIVKPTDATRLREMSQLLQDFWLNWNQSPPPPARSSL